MTTSWNYAFNWETDIWTALLSIGYATYFWMTGKQISQWIIIPHEQTTKIMLTLVVWTKWSSINNCDEQTHTWLSLYFQHLSFPCTNHLHFILPSAILPSYGINYSQASTFFRLSSGTSTTKFAHWPLPLSACEWKCMGAWQLKSHSARKHWNTSSSCSMESHNFWRHFSLQVKKKKKRFCGIITSQWKISWGKCSSFLLRWNIAAI